MATYDFDRFNIFLVEDNTYIRRTMEDLLKTLGFGRVITAESGADAIQHLKTMSDGKKMVGSLALDIIISDLVMSPVNGLLLVRWVRSAKESTNRMIPFIMLSGAADHEYVRAARDLGATEFLAKPFSVESVYKKILEVVDFPRQFVTTQKYFGPDRRRKNYGPPEEERRITEDDSVVIVYSADKVNKPKTPTDVWYFRLPNHLKGKAGGMGGSSGPGEIPTELIEQAEQQLERAALDFTDWALGYLAKLSDLCTEALMKPGRRDEYFHEINVLAHELRGQGGTFGYPLISIFGKMLYDVTGDGCSEDDSAVEIVKAHIDTMRAVLREKIVGDGGTLGRDLLKSLRAAIGKHSAPKKTAGDQTG